MSAFSFRVTNKIRRKPRKQTGLNAECRVSCQSVEPTTVVGFGLITARNICTFMEDVT